MTLEVIVAVLVLGLVVGLMSAMFGVGGGVIMVPFIVIVFEETQHVAEGTSLLVVVPTAIAGVIAHRKRGFVDLRAAAIVAATGVFGAYLGARFALSMDPSRLQAGFGVFTVAVGIKISYDGWQLRARHRTEDVPRSP